MISQILSTISEIVAVWWLKVVAAILILVVGRIAAGWLRALVRRLMTARAIDPMIVSFTASLTYVALMAFVVIAAVGQLGVQTTTFVAVVGAAGLAVGLALQGSLANFAAGVLMVLFKPFQVGNFIEASGVLGTVEEIEIFNTKLKSPDNKQIIIPNAQVIAGNITNFSAKETRRIDLVVGVSYQDDLALVKAVLLDILAADERVLKDPEPTVGVLELADSSIDFAVRPWVKSADYFPVLMDLNQRIKERFDSEGISIPFPQRDLHVFQADAKAG